MYKKKKKKKTVLFSLHSSHLTPKKHGESNFTTAVHAVFCLFFLFVFFFVFGLSKPRF